MFEKLRESIRKFIYSIIEDALSNRDTKTNLDNVADTARLILDCREGSIGIPSMNFLSRLNIDVDEYKIEKVYHKLSAEKKDRFVTYGDLR